MDRTKMKNTGVKCKTGIPTRRVKSGTKNKTKSVKRAKAGEMGKHSGKAVVFKPFMA